jgi:hypothetical protein
MRCLYTMYVDLYNARVMLSLLHALSLAWLSVKVLLLLLHYILCKSFNCLEFHLQGSTVKHSLNPDKFAQCRRQNMLF